MSGWQQVKYISTEADYLAYLQDVDRLAKGGMMKKSIRSICSEDGESVGFKVGNKTCHLGEVTAIIKCVDDPLWFEVQAEKGVVCHVNGRFISEVYFD